MTSAKKVLTTVALAAATVTSGAFAAPAQALPPDTPGCVHYWEFTHVRVSHKKFFVHDVFDTAGSVTSRANENGYVTETRSYRSCKLVNRTYISLTFEWDGRNWRLQDKSWYRW